MDYQEFKQLPRNEQFAAAGKIAGIPPEVFDGIWSTESGRGQHMLSQAGAEGHFQLMPQTRKSLEAKLGVAIDPYDFSSSLFAAASLMQENMATYKNIPDALRAYNNGPRPHMWNNPETSAYPGKVLGIAVEPSQAAAPKVKAKLTPLEKLIQFEAYKAGGMDAANKVTADPRAAAGAYLDALPGVPEPGSNTAAQARVDAPAEAAMAQAAAVTSLEEETSFGQQVGRALLNMPINRTILESVTGESYDDDPTFQITDEMVAGYVEDDRRELYQAGSQAEFDQISRFIQFRKDDSQQLEAAGTGTSIAAQLAAGVIDPVSLAAGLGVSKAFGMAKMGSQALAAQGRYGAAMASSIAENVAGNVGLTIGEQIADGHFSAVDLALNAVIGVGVGGLAGKLTNTAARSRFDPATLEALDGVEIEAHRYNADLTDEAAEAVAAETGTVDPKLVAEKSAEIEHTRVKGEIAAHTSPLPPEERVMDMDPISVDEVVNAQPVIEVKAPAPAPVKPDPKADPSKPPARSKREPKTVVPKKKKAKPVAATVEVDDSLIPKSATSGDIDEPEIPEHAFVDEGGDVQVRKPVAATVEVDDSLIPKSAKSGDIDEPEIPEHAFVDADDDVQVTLPTESVMAAVNREKDQLADLIMQEYPQKQWWDSRSIENAQKLDMDDTEVRDKAGISWAQAKTLPAGVHVMGDFGPAASVEAQRIIKTANELIGKYLPDQTILLAPLVGRGKSRGAIMSAGNVHIIRVRPKQGAAAAGRVLGHEIGHAIWHTFAASLTKDQLGALRREWVTVAQNSLERKQMSSLGRRSVTNPDSILLQERAPDVQKVGNNADNAYEVSLDEWVAESFVKHLERKMADGELADISPSMLKTLTELMRKVKLLFDELVLQKYTQPGDTVDEFFENVLNGSYQAKWTAEKLDNWYAQRVADETEKVRIKSDIEATTAKEYETEEFDTQAQIAQSQADIRNDPVARRYGMDIVPVDTAEERLNAKTMVDLVKRAEKWDVANPVDATRLRSITGRVGLGSTSLTLLKSEHPVARFIAAKLLESGSGAAGRRRTASISKHILEKQFMGTAMPQFEAIYKAYRKANKGGAMDDLLHGKVRAKFNRAVAEEIERRRSGTYSGSNNPAISQAADLAEAAFDRMRKAQIDAQTAGWSGLNQQTSRGYMPHRLSAAAIRNLTPEQGRVLHKALADQFVSISGFDQDFSDTLASRYIERVRRQGLGGFTADMNVHADGGIGNVQAIIQGLNLTPAEKNTAMQKFKAGAAGHTKQRLNLDLLQVHSSPDGDFRLMDVFETDVMTLMRGQSQRVSGEVALARFGIQGRYGLDVVRKAMEFGPKVKVEELKAFDQVAAEFLGAPFGTHSKNMERAAQATSLIRLGGMGFTQVAEYTNGIAAVGVRHTLAAVAGAPRLMAEARAIARGNDKVGGYLRDLEKFVGADFGTDSYTMRSPMDSPGMEHQLFGRDTVTVGDKLLRGGVYAQGVVSFWRSIHAAQERGFAEQITLRAVNFIKEGKNNVALRDMGISDATIAALRKDLPNIAKFSADGKLDSLDLAAATDVAAAEEFVQAIYRGTKQIIQGTFIGETGAWAHSSGLKLMTQFRSFGITAIEKQWARNRGNHGTAKALGILLGAMSLAWPIYAARVAVTSIGREDQEEYIERRLHPAAIARATLNYVSSAGLLGDFVDALSTVTGVGKESMTGGRAGQGTTFFGGTVAPAAGVIEDAWRGVQNLKEGTDPSQLLGTLPMSKVPALGIMINGLNSALSN